MTRRSEEFDLLDKLRQTGPLPHPLEERHQHLRRQQFFRAGLKCERYPPSTSSRLNPDMSVADWLRAKWTSADETVRSRLRLLADALNIPLPLIRTRPIARLGVANSSPARRTRPARHTSHGEPALSDTLAEKYGLDYHDPPAWDDELADGWVSSESITEALHDALDPEDRGWS